MPDRCQAHVGVWCVWDEGHGGSVSFHTLKRALARETGQSLPITSYSTQPEGGRSTTAVVAGDTAPSFYPHTPLNGFRHSFAPHKGGWQRRQVQQAIVKAYPEPLYNRKICQTSGDTRFGSNRALDNWSTKGCRISYLQYPAWQIYIRIVQPFSAGMCPAPPATSPPPRQPLTSSSSRYWTCVEPLEPSSAAILYY